MYVDNGICFNIPDSHKSLLAIHTAKTSWMKKAALQIYSAIVCYMRTTRNLLKTCLVGLKVLFIFFLLYFRLYVCRLNENIICGLSLEMKETIGDRQPRYFPTLCKYRGTDFTKSP